MIVGGIEEDLVKDQAIAKIPLPNPSMYEVTLEDFKVNGVVIVDKKLKMRTLLDTGNTLISLPMKYKDAFIGALKMKAPKAQCELNIESNEDFYQLGCRIKSKELPDVQISLGGVTFEIKGKDLIDQCSTLSGLGFLNFFKMNCLLNIEFQQGGYGGQVILGKILVDFFA